MWRSYLDHRSSASGGQRLGVRAAAGRSPLHEFPEAGGFPGGKRQLKAIQGSGRKAGRCRGTVLFCEGTGGGKEEPGL